MLRGHGSGRGLWRRLVIGAWLGLLGFVVEGGAGVVGAGRHLMRRHDGLSLRTLRGLGDCRPRLVGW